MNIYIGHDTRFPLVSDVAMYSIVDGLPPQRDRTYYTKRLSLPHLRKAYGYKHDPSRFSSTEFTYTRFLIPYLEKYEGIGIFVDNDVLCLGDIDDLLNQIQLKYGQYTEDWPALIVRKHDQEVPGNEVKMYGALQTSYPRKNWSSFMVMNCSKLGLWSKDEVERQTGSYLHQFYGIPEKEIVDVNDIQSGWNDLTVATMNTKLLHYTEGGPWFPNYQNCPHADLWLAKFKEYFGRDYYDTKPDIPSVSKS